MTSENWPSKVAAADQPLRQSISAETVVSAVSAAGCAPLTTKAEPGSVRNGGLDVAIGVEIVRPGEAAAQHQRRVGQGNGLFAAQTEFGAGGGDVLAVVAQRKGVGAGHRLLGIGRQAIGGELAGGIGREIAGCRRHAVPALEPSGNRIGIEAARSLSMPATVTVRLVVTSCQP